MIARNSLPSGFVAFLLLPFIGVAGCSGSTGPDLVGCACNCGTKGPGGGSATLIGSVCTKASDPSAVRDKCKSLCEGDAFGSSKECGRFYVGYCPTECGVAIPLDGVTTPTTCQTGPPGPGLACLNACTEGAVSQGDPGQAQSMSVPPSKVVFSGPLGISLTSTQGVVNANTTVNAENTLTFADLRAWEPNASILGLPVADAIALAKFPFVASFAAPGNYTVPRNTADFLLTAKVAGIRVAFDAKNTDDLTGEYDEGQAVFTLRGKIQDSAGIATAKLDVTFHFNNRPPHAVITAPAGPVQCTSPAGAAVTLSAANSTDPDGASDITEYLWVIDPGTFAEQLIPGMAVTPILSLGAHSVILFVFDHARSFGQATATPVVVNTEAPVFDYIHAIPSCLWPPNHEMVLYALGAGIQYGIHSTCNSTPPTPFISHVKDSQPFLGGGSGNTAPDFLNGTAAACLRAERAGTQRTPRSYTITLTAIDPQGNVASGSTIVTVAHDQADKCPNVDPSLVVADNEPACVAGAPFKAGHPTASLAQSEDPSVTTPRGGCESASGLVGPGVSAFCYWAIRRRRRENRGPRVSVVR